MTVLWKQVFDFSANEGSVMYGIKRGISGCVIYSFRYGFNSDYFFAERTQKKRNCACAAIGVQYSVFGFGIQKTDGCFIKDLGLCGINLQKGLRTDIVTASAYFMAQDCFAVNETEFFSEYHVCICGIDIMPNAGGFRQA